MKAFILAFACASAAFAGTPDFSGEWKLDIARSNFGREAPPKWKTLKIVQRDQSIQITVEDSATTTNPIRWDGQTLVSGNDRFTMTGTLGTMIQKRDDQTLVFVATMLRRPDSNFDETKVGTYRLPDPLTLSNGEPVTSADMWTKLRRPEIIKLFETNMFGRSPDAPRNLVFHSSDVRNGRKEVTISLPGHEAGPSLHLLIRLPPAATKPVPIFLGPNFSGNAATEPPDGKDAAHWPWDLVLARGYGLATMFYGDMAPDTDKTFRSGVYALFIKPGQTERAPDEWGAVAAWAWGLSRAMDYFQTDPTIDSKRVAVIGHSRLGKAALWAGASDPRFAMVISNDSGEGGAAISRRNFGETVRNINTSFPHWYAVNYRQFNDRPDSMPMDSNLLLSLVAPRPLYVASAAADLWSDPRGEFLGALGADPVYRLLGTDGLGVKEMPPIEHPVMTRIGYHIRSGKHDITDYDWEQYLKFADLHMRGR